jgi:hypothetical protein
MHWDPARSILTSLSCSGLRGGVESGLEHVLELAFILDTIQEGGALRGF